MSDRSPYEKLGVSEGATFEEIQTARARLVAELAGDQRKISEIEAAYDAVLMERLRLRQEGKIKVPEGIRFPEKTVTATVEKAAPTQPSPQWLQNLLDRPSVQEVALRAGVMGALGTLVYFQPTANVLQISMAIATGAALYFIYRKERKLGRSVLLGLLGLVLGFILGGVAFGLLSTQLAGLAIANDVFVSLVTFLVLWLVSSFTK
jgi:hypothetical protein